MTARNRPSTVYVVAATFSAALRHMRRPNGWRYVSHVSDVRGLDRDVEFVWVPGWHSRADAPEISSTVRAYRIRR